MRSLPLLERRREAIVARVARDVGAALASDAGSEEDAIVRAVAVAHAALEDRSERAREGGVEIACAAGCAWCCHVHVDATPAEVRAIVAYVAATASGAARAAMVASLERAVLHGAALDDEGRWARRVPCALLSTTGTCAVYPARPLRCRAFHSTSAARCEQAFDDALHGLGAAEPEQVGALVRACDAVERGFERALSTAGLETAPVRLEPALLTALLT